MASKAISAILNLKDNFSNSLKNISNNTGSFKKDLKDTGNEANNMKKTVSDAFSTIKQSVLRGIGFGAGLDIWGAMKEGIVETVTFSSDLQKSLNGIQSATGYADHAMAGMKDTMLEIYNDNFGENFEDIGNTLKTIGQQTGASGDQLKELAENALALRDTFDFDVNESVRSANMLMTQFGITGDDAFNLIAQGAQYGLNKNGDLLDVVNEYSVQFKKVGLNADEMFNAIRSGADSGAFSVDILSDGLKEFAIRAIDGSDTTVDGFTQLGLNADEMAKKFAQGGDTAGNAFKEVVKALANMKDPLKQSQVGIDLFGTKFEDLGVNAITALASVDKEIDSTYNALNDIKDINFDDIGSAFQYIKRNIQTGILIPIGDEVLPRLNDFAKWFGSNIPGIKENISSVTKIFLSIGSSIVDKVFPSIENLGESIYNLATTIYDNVIPAFGSVKPDNWNSVGDAVSGIIDRATETSNFINDNWTTIEPIIVSLTGAIIAWKTAIIAVNTWAAITTITTSAWGTIELMIWGIKNATTAWEAAQWLLNVAMDANPIGVVTIAIAALGFAIYEVIKHWQDIWSWIKSVWDVIDNNPILKFISFAINPLGTALMELITHWDKVVGAIKDAWNWLTSWTDKWNNTNLEDKNVNINTNQNTTTYTDDGNGNMVRRKISMNATGSQWWKGGWTTVSEGGRGELINLPSGSQIIPANKTNKILDSKGGHVFNIYFSGNVGTEEFFNQAGTHIIGEIKKALINF